MGEAYNRIAARREQPHVFACSRAAILFAKRARKGLKSLDSASELTMNSGRRTGAEPSSNRRRMSDDPAPDSTNLRRHPAGPDRAI